MKKSRIFSLLGLFALCLTGLSAAQDDAEVHFKQISVSGQFDNGQVVSGKVNHYDLNLPDTKLKGDFFQRTGVWITQEATVKERLALTVGVGGVFWYALPVSSQSAARQTQFGPGISQAQGTYNFGDPKNPPVSLQMGYFPYKYNSDAKNLGEYLLRSGTYPGYLVSGGWNMISSAGYMVQGFRLNVSMWGGKFQSDFLLAMEHDIPPLYDVSLSYIATLKPIAGIDIGAGVTCNHCIPIKPSLESPHKKENQIIKSVSVDSSQIVIAPYVVSPADPTDTTFVVFDSTGTHYVSGPYKYVSGAYNYNYNRDTTSFYTFQGVKIVGRVSLDPKAFIPMSLLGPEDLKIYGEIALLGVKNYGYMYDDPLERMPVMVGLNLPAFKLLDVLSFEMEYYNSKYPNNIVNLIYNEYPTWYLQGADGSPATPAEVAGYASDARLDNWKWSVYAKKQIVKGIQIYAQVASDHIRTIQLNGGPTPDLVPVTNRNGKDWYYIVRLQFGI